MDWQYLIPRHSCGEYPLILRTKARHDWTIVQIRCGCGEVGCELAYKHPMDENGVVDSVIKAWVRQVIR